MAIAGRLEWYLNHQGVVHEVIPHPPTGSSRQTAQVAHVDEDHLAKSVLLEDERGYLLTVLPASRRVSLEDLRQQLGRRLELATEAELSEIFDDCQVGAVPRSAARTGYPRLSTRLSCTWRMFTSRRASTRTSSMSGERSSLASWPAHRRSC